MKKLAFAIALSLLLGKSSFGQVPFDVCAGSIFYTVPGADIVQADFDGTEWVNTATFAESGQINGLGCNPVDGCLYYLKNVGGGICNLIRMDATGATTVINTTMTYTVNGGVDVCGNYIQYLGGNLVKTDIITGAVSTQPAGALGFITDVDYNPFNCNGYFNLFGAGNEYEVDASGTLLNTILSPEAGTTGIGGMALGPDGNSIYLTKTSNLWSYDLTSGLLIVNQTLATPASGPPIADLAAFQCEDVVADIQGGTDTLFINTCEDSVTINFDNFTTGSINIMQWDFGDGTFNVSDTFPSHTYAADSTYEIEFFASRWPCETCHYSEVNYDTLVLSIQPYTIDATITGTDPSCTGADGSATVSDTLGAVGPLNYAWSSGGTGVTETPLAGGIMYYVTVTDANSCAETDSVILINPNPVDVNLTTTDPTCNGDNDGTATVSPTIPGTPLNFNWSSGGIAATEGSLIDGSYNVIVTDPSGCDTTIVFTITEPAVVTALAAIDTTICQNGSATLTAAGFGGNGGPYTLTWTGLGTGSPIVSPTVNTCFDVVATDIAGCPSAADNLCVSLLAPLNVAVNGTDICPQSSADLSSVSAGGDGNYTYSWNLSGSTVGTSPTLSMPQSTTSTYCLTLDDGCETTQVSACITIDIYPEPDVNFTPQQICAGETVNFPNPVLDPTGILNYDWSFGDGGTSFDSSPSHAYANDGIYDVSLSLITTENCTYIVDFNSLITVDAVPYASFSYNPQVITVEDTEVDFTNQSIDATSFVWDFGDQTPNTSEISPSHTFPGVGDVNYTVTLWAYNGVCSDSYQQVIHVQDVIVFYVPNVFTPDGDSYNETFKPIMTSGYDPYDYHMTIFNRWGEIVFESYNASTGWDGAYGNQGLVQDGVYVWTLEFKETMSDKQHAHQGHVTILR